MPSVILIILFLSLSIGAKSLAFDRQYLHQTSFDKTENRYPSVLAVLESLKRLAPFQPSVQTRKELNACLTVNADSVNIIGAIDPAQIQPLETQPGALFFNYFENCAKQIILSAFNDPQLAKRNAELILGNNLIRSIGNAHWSAIQFSQIPVELQSQIVDRMIFFIIGPEEMLSYFNYIGSTNVFRAPLNNAAELRNFLRENLMTTQPNDTLLGFYTRLATLLRLGPILKS
ncbi:MAG: hypothetical protein H7061_06095 [Bdellovibrionaceae bacterium]|nr:hypothetical protein [Bdellovibrio sp.]